MFDGKLCAKRLTFLFVAYACGLIQAYLMQTHQIHWWVAGALVFMFILTAVESWDRKARAAGQSGLSAADLPEPGTAPSSHPGTSRSPA